MKYFQIDFDLELNGEITSRYFESEVARHKDDLIEELLDNGDLDEQDLELVKEISQISKEEYDESYTSAL